MIATGLISQVPLKGSTAPRRSETGREFAMNKSEVKKIIDRCGLRPNKRLGQNFLIADDVRDRIIDSLSLNAGDRVLEIGPGLGALTERLVESAGMVTAIEIDSGFSRYLAERFAGNGNFRLIHGDFIKSPPEDSYTKIVSNLPYYCSSEILFGITRYDAPHAYVMLQKELADRIAALPGERSYGALSVTVGFYYEPKVLFRVSRESFYPIPEVTSTFLMLARRASFPLEGDDVALFHELVKSAFWGRRKTILTALSGSPHTDIARDRASRMLAHAGIDGKRRGEELSRDEYVSLVRAYRYIEA
jgi:16S rRNA (adenine1518-N6/adenine1519-N6)-dimethyltransferase